MAQDIKYQGHRWSVIPHLVDGEDPVADHVGLTADETGEHKTRTVTQHHTVIDVQCLKGERGREGGREGGMEGGNRIIEHHGLD